MKEGELVDNHCETAGTVLVAAGRDGILVGQLFPAILTGTLVAMAMGSPSKP